MGAGVVQRLWIGWTFFKNPLASWGRGIPGVALSRGEEALLMAFAKGLGRLQSSPDTSSPPASPSTTTPAPTLDNPNLVPGEVYGPTNPIPAPPGGYPPIPSGWGGSAEAYYRYLLASGQVDP